MDAQKIIEKFIYSCSHDLRAPIASIQGLVRIAEYYPHHEETHKCLEMIESCTETLDKLIRRLEEFMINDAHVSLQERTTASNLTQQIELDFRKQLESANIQLAWCVDDEALKKIDAFALVRILRYLIANSIAYHDTTKTERYIRVKIANADAYATLEIADNGIGIREDQRDRLFEVFRRGSENSIGLGMGLFLTKGLADKLGATVNCQSEVGKGTTFLLDIPENTPAISEKRPTETFFSKPEESVQRLNNVLSSSRMNS